MTDNQKAAYVVAQSVEAFAEIQGMIALNQYRMARGETIAYDEEAFLKVPESHGISHNQTITLFHGG